MGFGTSEWGDEFESALDELTEPTGEQLLDKGYIRQRPECWWKMQQRDLSTAAENAATKDRP